MIISSFLIADLVIAKRHVLLKPMRDDVLNTFVCIVWFQYYFSNSVPLISLLLSMLTFSLSLSTSKSNTDRLQNTTIDYLTSSTVPIKDSTVPATNSKVQSDVKLDYIG